MAKPWANDGQTMDNTMNTKRTQHEDAMESLWITTRRNKHKHSNGTTTTTHNDQQWKICNETGILGQTLAEYWSIPPTPKSLSRRDKGNNTKTSTTPATNTNISGRCAARSLSKPSHAHSTTDHTPLPRLATFLGHQQRIKPQLIPRLVGLAYHRAGCCP